MVDLVRIVSLVPSITLALDQLGAGGELVAVTDYCVHPEELVKGLPRVGGTKNPDLEKIRSLRPDLVVANTDEQRLETLKKLEEGPWDLLVTQTDSLGDVAGTWTAIGSAVAREDEARLRREAMEAALADARARALDRPPIDVLVPVWKNPWMAAGGGTYLGDLLEACGLHNVLSQVEEKWVLFALTTDPEEAEAQRPEKGPFKDRHIVALAKTPHAVLLPTEPYAFTEEHRDLFKPLGVPRDRVRVVDGELLTWWLSHTTEALVEFTALTERLREPSATGSSSG